MSNETVTHQLLPGSRSRVRCHAPGAVRRTDKPSRVTCPACRGVTPALTADQLTARAFVAGRTLVGGRWRETLPCECGCLMVAGIDHACDPANRKAVALT